MLSAIPKYMGSFSQKQRRLDSKAFTTGGVLSIRQSYFFAKFTGNHLFFFLFFVFFFYSLFKVDITNIVILLIYNILIQID